MPVGPTALVRPDLELYDAWAACVEDYSTRTRVNRHPGAGMAIQLSPGSDALRTADLAQRIVETVESLRPQAKDKDVVLYCRSGRRSALAADVLAANGYKRLSHLEGDMQAWVARGRPVEQRPAP